MRYRDIGLGLGAFVGSVATLIGGAALLDRLPSGIRKAAALTSNDIGTGDVGTGEHIPTDLMRPDHPGFADRAVDAFRPDPTAPVPASEREALRPASLGPVSSSPIV